MLFIIKTTQIRMTTDQELMGSAAYSHSKCCFHSLGGSTALCCMTGHQVYLCEEHSCQILFRSDLKRGSLSLFWREVTQTRTRTTRWAL